MPSISREPSPPAISTLSMSEAPAARTGGPRASTAVAIDPRLPKPRSPVGESASSVPRTRRQLLPLSALSERKQIFLGDSHPKTSQRISVDTLGKVGDGKTAKHGIEIQVNGDGTALKQAQSAWRLGNNANPASADDIYNAVDEAHGMLEPIFQEQLNDREKFADTINSNAALRSVFEEEMARTIGLSPGEAAHDMTAVLARAQQEKRAIGYIYTTRNPMEAKGVAQGFGHSDSYIMAPNGRVLNIVPYPTAACDEVRQRLTDAQIPFALADFSNIIPPRRPVNMQADASACGSLAVTQLKEYLRNDAHQLKEHSLVISGLQEMGEGGDFLLPSPQALRFSQSTLPLTIADAMVRESGDRAEFTHDGRTYSVPTLSGMVRGGARCETAFGTSVEDLDAFRRRWCAAMDQAEDKRDALNLEIASGVQNGSLAQVSQRHAALGSSKSR